MSQHLVEQRKRRIRNFLLPLKSRFKIQIRDGIKPHIDKDEYIAEYCIATGVRPTVANKYLKLYTCTHTLYIIDDDIQPSHSLITELKQIIKDDDAFNKQLKQAIKQKNSEKKS